MNIEIKTEEERQELLRAIRLAERIPLPFTADLTRIRDELTGGIINKKSKVE